MASVLGEVVINYFPFIIFVAFLLVSTLSIYVYRNAKRPSSK